MRKILLTLLTTLLCSVTAWGANGDVLFSQNFNSATAVAYTNGSATSYTVASANNNIVGNTAASQFTYIAVTSKDKVGIAINSSTGGNSVDATGIFQAYCNNTGHQYSLVKTTDFAATAPKAIKVSMKILFKQLSSGSAYSATFAIGDDFSDETAAPAASNVHSGFSISNNSTAYFCPYLTYTGFSGSSSITQNSWLTITWVINNSGETLTYTNPNSTSSTLANDKFDVWVGTTRFLEAQSASTATKDLQNLYIGDPSGKKHELRLDDIVVTDLTPSSCTSITPTLSYSSTTLAIGDNSSTPTIDGNEGSGAVTYDITTATPSGCATVNNSTGVVTGVHAGTATVTASIAAASTYCSGTATANFTISCNSITPTFSTDYTSTTLTVGGDNSSTPVINKNGSSGAITWGSSDKDVATVNSSGVVTPVASGSATITATVAANGDYCEGSVSKNFTINAAACSPSISASPSSANYCKDDVATALSFTGSGHNAQKWQRSTDGGSSWSDIDGATNATYTPPTSATGSTQYRVVTTCDSYTTTATSSAATVTVKTSPNLTISLN